MMIRRLGFAALLVLVGGLSGASAQPAPGYTDQQLVIPIAPAGTPAYGQVSVATTLTLIRPANASRATLTLVNHGTNNVFIGYTNGLSASNGAMLAGVPGQSLVISTRSDVYGIAVGGAQTVGFLEENR